MRGRIAVACRLTLCSILLLSSLALQAMGQGNNHWSITYQTSGGFTWTAKDNAGYFTSGSKAAIHHSKFGSKYGCQDVVADMSVTVTATLTWVDGSNQPVTPGPTDARFIEYTTAEADNLNTGTYSGTADDGYGDAVVDNGTGLTSSGKHLIRRNGASGVITVSRTFTSHFHVSGGPDQGYCMLDWGYTIAPDTRNVTLVRDGAHGETVDGNGVTHGDTTYSYYDNIIPQYGSPYNVNHINWQVFHPVFTGGWTMKWDSQTSDFIPDVTWSWNPSASGDTWNTGNWSMPMGTRYWVSPYFTSAHWDGTIDQPQANSITYTATDVADGAACIAQYVLTMHDPIEVKTEDTPTLYYDNPRPVGPAWSPSYVGETGKVTATWTVTYSVAVTFNDIFGKWFCDWKPINVAVTYTGATATGAEFNVGPNIAVGDRVWVEAVDTYLNHTGTEDTWDTGGYAGLVNYSVKEPASPYCTVRLHWPPQH